jgi:curli production assembly/transport component CsgF
MSKTGFRIGCVAGLLGLLTPAFATEQVYHPISPTFGGNPSNGPFLLSVAQGQGEGVNSGNQGPNLTGLTNALNNLGTSGTGTGGSGTSGSGTSGSNATANSNTVANPTGHWSRMP